MFSRARLTWVVLASVLGLVVLGCQTGAPTSTPGRVSKIRPATTGTVVPATPEAIEEARAEILRKDRAQRAMWANKTFEEFEKSVFKEPFPGGKYIVNGDVAFADRKQLQEFFETSIKQEPPQTRPGQLIVNRAGGQDSVWNNTQKKQITYCVSTTFGARQAAVVTAMQSATGAWSEVADVAFVYTASQNSTCTASNANVVFDVRPVNVNGEYLARAFFPNEPRAGRNVLIDESAFQLDPAGKLSMVAFKPIIREPKEQPAPAVASPVKGSMFIALTAVGDKPLGGACMTSAGAAVNSTSGCDSCHMVDDQMAFLREETKKRGFPTIDGVHMGPCEIHRSHAHTISPDGSLYACPGFAGDATQSVGHIDGRQEPARSHAASRFEALSAWQECRDCSFIPVCAGGCTVAAYNELGSIDKPNCHKAAIQAGLVSLARQAAAERTATVN